VNKKLGVFIQDIFMPYGKLGTAIRLKAERVLVSHVFRQTDVGLIGALLCATILIVGLYQASNPVSLLIWYALFWVVTLVRFTIVKVYLNRTSAEKEINLWRLLLILGAGFSGLLWGVLGSFLLPYEYSMQLTLVILVLAGITAGAVPLLSGILPASIIFLITSLTPLAIRLLTLQTEAYVLFGGAAIIYLGFLIILSVRTHNTIAYSVALQFENDVLLENLSLAKNQLEISNKKLEHAATHDFLTDLPNRSLFGANLIEALEEAQRDQKILALFYIDLDNFKEVNDAYGHHIGDELLQKMVERIKRRLTADAVAARLGGDELTVILRNIGDVEVIRDFAKQLCDISVNPFEIKDFTIITSLSVGVSIFPIDGRDIEQLLKNADKAMYFVKERGGNSFHFNTELLTAKTLLKNSFSNFPENHL
jgi:diguanylate cyclase (GGDEF)-like protein